MPIAEVLKINATLVSVGFTQVGPVTWYWTDDNSNYYGIYTDGPLRGWLTYLNHEEPRLTPAYRSVSSFLSYLADNEIDSEDGEFSDLDTEIPAIESTPTHTESDKQLADHFRELFLKEQDAQKRQLFAFCSICLTPVENTRDILAFLECDDMWIPEGAVRLLELRGYEGCIEKLEKLAQEGLHNGSSAAMRQLVRLQTGSAKMAVARLKQTLTGQKRQVLEMWDRGQLQPPRWP